MNLAKRPKDTWHIECTNQDAPAPPMTQCRAAQRPTPGIAQVASLLLQPPVRRTTTCVGEKKKKKRKDKKQTTTSAEMLCTLQVLASVKPAPTDATQIYNAGRKAHVTRMDSAQHRAAAVCTPQPPPTPCCRQRWSTPGLHIQMSTSVQGTRRKGLQLGCFYSRPLYKTRPGRHCLQTRVEKAGRTTVAPLPLASLKRDLNSL